MPGMAREWGPTFRPYAGELCEKEAIPFLLEVIENGPDWPKEDVSGYRRLGFHIARCYAVLCLASTKEPQAYSVLTDLLQNGAYIEDPNMDERTKQIHDIRGYAAAGLGFLNNNRASDLLVIALDDTNSFVRHQSMYALAKLKDVRSIEPILNAAQKHELDDFSLDSCMTKITKTRLSTKLNREERSVTFPDFPELGTIKLEENPYRKAWLHWFREGKSWTQEQFENRYAQYAEVTSTRPNEEGAITYCRWKIANSAGVAGLPLIIDKIEQGHVDLIPLVSTLTDKEVSKEVDAAEVLTWWQANKDRWTIFDYGQQSGPAGGTGAKSVYGAF